MHLAHADPAAGAPLGELVPAAIVGAVIVAALVAFGVAHRSGKTSLLTRTGAFAERVSGLPPWAGVGASVTALSLLVAVFGFYWDVATHIDNGRDPGPFANPSHFLIIGGLAGIALAGVLACLLGSRPTSTSVCLRAGWEVPLGGLLLLLCGGIAVLGFPLDDVWHRLFGQDVTLWSPTHLQMVGGAALSTLALWILLVEGGRTDSADEARRLRTMRLAEPFLAGAFLIGLSAFHAEFDYSVPQFRLLYHPVLLMLTSGVALVAARIRLGHLGALKAVGFFILLRALLSLAIGPVMGHTTLHFPLYLVEALGVEIVASTMGTERRVRFGAAAGAVIGTFGLAAEWGWSQVWMTIPWPGSLMPEGIFLGFGAAVAGGAFGGFIGRALTDPPQQSTPAARPVAWATAAGVLVALAYPLPTDAALEGRTEMSLRSAGDSRARLEVQLEPRDVADEAEWFNVTAWQGGGSVVEPFVRTSDGRYRTENAVPIGGEWKTMVRLHRGRSLMAAPVYLPEDAAIPAPEVPARDQVARPLTSDKKMVLREAKEVGPELIYPASILLVSLVGVWVAALGWGLHRLERQRPGRSRAGAAVPVTG
ncbi:MAG: hypothetical protein ACRDK3_16200 [Actinomycetota bacterium]